jgi:hypothetical protein
MVIPELVIFNFLESLLAFVKKDINSNTDKTKTIIYYLFNNIKFQNFDFYKSALEFLTREADNPRQLQVRLGFDSSRAVMPTVHITLPSERSGQQGIGIDEGYVENEVDTTEKKENPIYTRIYECQYACIITSDNVLEVTLLYNLLKGLLVGSLDILELNGLRNIKLSGQDMQLSEEIVPINVFAKGLMLDFFYEVSVKKLLPNNLISHLEFEGTPLLQNTTSI